jgi:hypothetical protein
MNIRAAITPQSGLGLLCGLLLMAGLFEAWAPLPKVVAPAQTAVAQVPTQPLPIAFTPPPSNAFDAVNDRPIFSPARKPFMSVAAVGPSATATPPAVTLIGVILDGKTSMALIKSAASPLETAFNVGQTIEGWLVSEIDADKIVLSSGGARDEIKLEANKAPKGPNTTAATTLHKQQPALLQQQMEPAISTAVGQHSAASGSAAPPQQPTSQ